MSSALALGLDKPAASPTRRGMRKRTASKQSGMHVRGHAPPHGHRPPPTATASDVIGQYTDREGRSHEIVARAGAGGSVLVIDRDALTFGDRRLVAHLGVDEPAANARVVCEQYLADVRGRWCRPVTAADLQSIPRPEEEDDPHVEVALAALLGSDLVVDPRERFYRLEAVPSGMSIPEMRWQQYPPEGQAGRPRVLTIRDAIAALESYEPIRTLTRTALARDRRDPTVSVSVLRAEMERVCASRIVLNRGLREAVLSTARSKSLSMSEIAMRCGHVKYDSRRNVSGDTSWLTRRLGLKPESGESSPTPWIHSEVLALIARQGLGISPREVELG